MKKMALSLLAIAGLFVVGCNFVANVTYPSNPKDWTQEMRRAAPDKFAKVVETFTEAQLADIKTRLDGLDVADQEYNAQYKENKKKIKFLKGLGSEMVAALKSNKFPVTIKTTGTAYEKHELVAQIDIVQTQTATCQRLLTDIESSFETLQAERKKLNLMEQKHQEQLAEVKANVEVFKARKITDEGMNLLDECSTLLLEAETFLERQAPVVDVDTLMARAERVAADEAVAPVTDIAALEAFFASDEAEEAEDVEVEEEIDFETEGKGKGTKNLETTLDEEDIPEEPAN